MSISSQNVKQISADLGADLCGIASIGRFNGAPKGYNPGDVLPGCKSVIVLARHSVNSTLLANSTIPYSVMRDHILDRMSTMAIQLSDILESKGVTAIPVGSTEPTILDLENRKLRGIISLKHAAVFAGLGKMGKNTLLINDKYGNMLWLSAVLTLAELDPDPIAPYESCIEDCRLCLETCPVKALDGISIDQGKCGRYAFGDEMVGPAHVGGQRIKCNTCRKVCPHGLGIKAAASKITT